MSFYLPVGSREFFRIKNGRTFANTESGNPRFLMFDAFACCLLVGIDKRKHGDQTQLESKTFIDGYPDAQKNQAEIIAGLLVEAELTRQDISPKDAKSIEKEMVRLLDLTSPTRLSITGNGLLNLYAAAGFESLRCELSSPETLEDFITEFARFWNASA